MDTAGVGEAAAQLRADLAMLDASTKEAASLLDLAAWQLGELGHQAAPMTSKTLALAQARTNIQVTGAGCSCWRGACHATGYVAAVCG